MIFDKIIFSLSPVKILDYRERARERVVSDSYSISSSFFKLKLKGEIMRLLTLALVGFLLVVTLEQETNGQRLLPDLLVNGSTPEWNWGMVVVSGPPTVAITRASIDWDTASPIHNGKVNIRQAFSQEFVPDPAIWPMMGPDFSLRYVETESYSYVGQFAFHNSDVHDYIANLPVGGNSRYRGYRFWSFDASDDRIIDTTPSGDLIIAHPKYTNWNTWGTLAGDYEYISPRQWTGMSSANISARFHMQNVVQDAAGVPWRVAAPMFGDGDVNTVIVFVYDLSAIEPLGDVFVEVIVDPLRAPPAGRPFPLPHAIAELPDLDVSGVDNVAVAINYGDLGYEHGDRIAVMLRVMQSRPFLFDRELGSDTFEIEVKDEN